MNTRSLVIGGIIIIIGALGFIILTAKPKQQSQDKLQVVASFYPVYFFAQEIGREKAEIRNIVPAGAEPHDYEPTPQDMVAIQESDLFVLNGAGFEAWGERVIEGLPETVIVVEAGEGLATLPGSEEEHEEEGHDHGAFDPHVWLSPALAQMMVDRIAEGFVRVDPGNAAYYSANAETLKTKLAQLDADYRAGLTSCAKRDIITSHAAFGYIAEAYDLRQIAIGGLSPEAEPSAQELAEIAEFARANKVDYIFFETLVPADLSQTIANEVEAQTLVLNPLEGLTGAEIAAGKTYLTEMRGNLQNLRTALQCK